MSKVMIFVFVCISASILVLSSCEAEKTEDTPTPSPNEFVASDADFENFRNWTVIKKLDKALSDDGRAHSDAARTIWIKQSNATRSQNGQYPTGTILVKEVQGGYGIVAMVKRGGTYNANHQGWEWFKLDSAGKILNRNSSNTCNNCHAKAKDLDYAFTKN